MARTPPKIDLSPDLLSELTAIAEMSGSTVDDIIGMLLRPSLPGPAIALPADLEAWLQRQEEAGLREAASGELAPHQDVEQMVHAWAVDASRRRSGEC